MANPVMRWQILTKQPKKLEEFYSALFAWKISGDYPLGYRPVDTVSKEGIHGGFWPCFAASEVRLDKIRRQIRADRM